MHGPTRPPKNPVPTIRLEVIAGKGGTQKGSLFRFLYALSGFALAGLIATGWFLSMPHYDRPLSGEARIYLQKEYPGGKFKNIWEYQRCEWVYRIDTGERKQLAWVIYKSGGEVNVTEQNCWVEPKSTNSGDAP